MADRTEARDRTTYHQVQVHPHHTAQRPTGPSTSKVIALVTLIPVSGTLLFLAGITLVGSIIGLCITTPLFILFSPVLVPAALLMGLAVMGFLSSGAFGLTGLSSLSRVLGYLRQVGQRVPDDLDYAKRRMADMAAYAGQKTKDVGQTIENRARESGTTTASVRT